MSWRKKQSFNIFWENSKVQYFFRSISFFKSIKTKTFPGLIKLAWKIVDFIKHFTHIYIIHAHPVAFVSRNLILLQTAEKNVMKYFIKNSLVVWILYFCVNIKEIGTKAKFM